MSQRNVNVILAISLALSLAAEAQMHAGPQIPVPARIEVPPNGITLAMSDMGGRPVIEVKINGKGPYRFVLDTGATITIVSDELAKELSLVAPAGMQVAPVGGGPPPAIVMIREVRVGDATLRGTIAAVRPLSGLLKGENPPQGVLSAASFPGYLLTFNFPENRILVKQGALDASDSKSIFQYTEDQVLPTVPIRIADHDTFVHLDTGSAFGLTLPVKFLNELPLASAPEDDGIARTGAGEFPVSIARVKGAIELGKFKLDLGKVRFSDVRPGPGPALGDIGYEVLRYFVVTLDSTNRRIKLAQ